MDALLTEFLTETSESLDGIDAELVKFEHDPNNAEILDNIFRLLHTINDTCGCFGLPKLEALAHAGETLMGKYRDGVPVTLEGVRIMLESIDRLKQNLEVLEQTGAEPTGSGEDLILQLERMAKSDDGAAEAASSPAAVANADVSGHAPEPVSVAVQQGQAMFLWAVVVRTVSDVGLSVPVRSPPSSRRLSTSDKQPFCSARSAPEREPARLSGYRRRTPLPCNFSSMKSARGSPSAPSRS